MTIQHLGDAVVLSTPLYITVEQFNDECLATQSDLALVGRGETQFDAIDDLREQVRELFDALLEMRDTLGEALQAQLRFLERLSGRL